MLHGLLCLLPALALALPLLARRYPGERVVLAWRTRGRRARRPLPCSVSGSRGRRVVAAVAGGLLIGRSLAVRPPPTQLAS